MGRLLDGLIGWSIHNRAVVLIGAVALMVWGGWITRSAPLDVLPDFTPAWVVVQTEAPGMGAVDVEQFVTQPLERVLLGTPKVANVRSASMPGLSAVTLMFEEAVDVYRARQLVAERLQSVRLPEAVRAPQLQPVSAPIGSLLKFCITSPDGRASMRQIRSFVDWVLRQRLLSVPGVSQLIVVGGDVERLEVRPDPVRMRDRGVRMSELVLAVQSSQAVEGAGFIDRGDARLDVVHEGRLDLDLAPVQLAEAHLPLQAKAPLRVGDVAEVVRGDEPKVGAALYDGMPAVYVQVMKLPAADTRQVTAAVEQALRELGPQLPAGARLEPPVYRQVDFIDTSIWSVGRAMLIGSLLVTAILAAFLRKGRLAVISLAAVPLSLVAAISVLVAFGASINGMTLGGLAIAVGEVVDDAIVDVENVWRRLRENARLAAPRPALAVIHDASVEVRGVVVYATIIVCLVLVPVLAMGGLAGRIFSPLAEAYVLAIMASLVVALTVTPAMCAWLMPSIATPKAELPGLSVRLAGRYRALLERLIARPRPVFVATSIAAVAAIAALPLLGGRFLPEFHESTLIGHANALPGTSLDETVRLAGRVDAQLRPAVADHVASRAGRGELGEDAVPVNQVELDVVLKKDDARSWDELIFDVVSRIGRVSGVGVAVEGSLGERVHEVLSGQTDPVVVNVMGPDLDQLRAIVSEVAKVMQGTPGLSAVRPEAQVDVPQLNIKPNRVALAKLGLTERALVDDVAQWRQGRPVTQLLGTDGRVLDVVVAGGPESRDALGDLLIDRSTSAPVPLSAVADIDVVQGPAVVFHEAGLRRISIGASAPGSGLSSAVSTLQARLAREVKLPSGYRIEVAGEAAARSDAALSLLLTGVLVGFGIFVLLTFALRSLADAGIVLLNFPLGMVGGVAAALLNPEGLSVAGLVGFVTLFGIIARNGIMLVAHKRHLDATCPTEDPVHRIVRCAEERLLPILMTAAAAGLGLLPLALSMSGRGSELEAPMAVIVIGGLVSSTVLNMLVLPVLYVWLERRPKRGLA